MKLRLKHIDATFLFLFIFIIQEHIIIKLFGILLALLIRPTAVLKITRLNLFYLLLLLYHIAYGACLLVFGSFEYFPNYLLSTSFWLISFIALTQIYYFIKSNDIQTIWNTIDLLFYIHILAGLAQLVYIFILFDSFNPYGASTSAGDYIKSIYSNSSVNLIAMSFFAVQYGYRRNKFKTALAVLMMIMTTYMSGLVLFLFALLVSSYFFSRIKLKYKVGILFVAIIFIGIFKQVSPNNVTYVSRYLNRIVENDEDTPYKIKSFRETIDYMGSSIQNLTLGAGGGNFSSRSAFICSGKYVSWYPKQLAYISPEFNKYHYSIWTHDFKNPWDNINNTANQPFSFYNQISGEYGLVGIFIFLVFYIGFILSRWKQTTYSKILLICLLSYFVLDYWFEYFSVIILFELFLLTDLKSSKNTED